MGAGTLSAQAQTYFEPAAKDVVTPTGLQKNVSRSTDIVMLALPVATLAGVLIERDWDGLVQGIETAGATAAATLILKYAVCERRPDGSDMHSFPSAHSAVRLCDCCISSTALWLGVRCSGICSCRLCRVGKGIFR